MPPFLTERPYWGRDSLWLTSPAVRATFALLSWNEPSLEVGEDVADTHITRQLAVGGGVEVWAGETEAGEPRVALALVEAAGQDARDRFLVEANRWIENWDSLSVPGLLEVVAVDPLAATYVGKCKAQATLATHILKHWPEAKRVTIFRSVAKTMAALHEKGVVHGSLRPENVLINAAGEPVIANARLYDLSTACRTDATAARLHQPFTAPEVRHGTNANAESDVY